MSSPRPPSKNTKKSDMKPTAKVNKKISKDYRKRNNSNPTKFEIADKRDPCVSKQPRPEFIHSAPVTYILLLPFFRQNFLLYTTSKWRMIHFSVIVHFKIFTIRKFLAFPKIKSKHFKTQHHNAARIGSSWEYFNFPENLKSNQKRFVFFWLKHIK